MKSFGHAVSTIAKVLSVLISIKLGTSASAINVIYHFRFDPHSYTSLILHESQIKRHTFPAKLLIAQESLSACLCKNLQL
jgi:hypothetical protein